MLRVAWDMTTLPEIKNSFASILDTKVTGDIAVRFVQWDLYRQSSDCEFSALIHLTHSFPMFPFCTPRKHQKTKGFLMVSGGVKREHLKKMC